MYLMEKKVYGHFKQLKMTENRYSFVKHFSFLSPSLCVSLCVCVSGWGIPEVSKVPYLDPWQWNSPLCVFH